MKKKWTRREGKVCRAALGKGLDTPTDWRYEEGVLKGVLPGVVQEVRHTSSTPAPEDLVM